MNKISSLFDDHLSELDNEIEIFENQKKDFEDLRYTNFDVYANLDNHLVYMVSNGIQLIDNIDQFNKIKDPEEKFDFLLEDGNWPHWNDKYVKEVLEYTYVCVLYEVKRRIRLIKSELSTKYNYYDYDDYKKLIISYLDKFHLTLKNHSGLKYFYGDNHNTHYKIFNNKLDIICDISLGYSSEVYDGACTDIIKDPKVWEDYCYPGILIDREQWYEYENSCRMIGILNDLLQEKSPSNTSKKVNWHLNHKISLLDTIGALDNLPRNHSGDLNKFLAAKVLSLLLEYDFNNIRKALGNLEKQPSKLTAKQRKDQEDVKKTLKGLGWDVG